MYPRQMPSFPRYNRNLKIRAILPGRCGVRSDEGTRRERTVTQPARILLNTAPHFVLFLFEPQRKDLSTDGRFRFNEDPTTGQSQDNRDNGCAAGQSHQNGKAGTRASMVIRSSSDS